MAVPSPTSRGTTAVLPALTREAPCHDCMARARAALSPPPAPTPTIAVGWKVLYMLSLMDRYPESLSPEPSQSAEDIKLPIYVRTQYYHPIIRHHGPRQRPSPQESPLNYLILFS